MRQFSLFFALLLSFSCTTPKAMNEAREFDKGREPGEAFFVTKPDGQKMAATKISRPSVGNHTENRITADGQQMDAPDQVMAFQDANGYYKFFKDPKPTRYWKGEFIKRMRAGKTMSLYLKAFYVGVHEEYYYFDKNNGPLTLLTYENFSAALSDKPALKAEFEKLYPKKKIMANRQFEENSTNLPRLVEMYNQ
jgi:hypothetical protein